MPAYLKLIISVIVASVAWAAFSFGVKGGIVIPILAVMMIIAVWLFPETKRLPENDKN
jgi:integral membrane sensor domain MASE1